MHGERANARYPVDIKIEAVRLYRESDESLEEVAEDLGVRTNALGEGVERLGVDPGVRLGPVVAGRMNSFGGALHGCSSLRVMPSTRSVRARALARRVGRVCHARVRRRRPNRRGRLLVL